MIAGGTWIAAARAQPLDDLALQWQVPDTCPNEMAVLARIRVHLPKQHRTARRWSVEGRITSEDGRYLMELVLQSGESQAKRTIVNESCAALVDAAALLIALALDPEATPDEHEEAQGGETGAGARAAGSSPSHPAKAPPTPQGSDALDSGEDRAVLSTPTEGAAEDRAEAEAADAPAQEIDLGLDFGAALRLDSGMLPQTPAFGVQPQLGVSFGRVSIRLGITLWLEARTSSDSYPSATLEGRGLLGDAAVCAELLGAPLALAPCAVGEFGQLVLESHEISTPGSSEAGWAAAGGGVRLGHLVTGRLWVTLDAHLLAPFSRPRWLVRTMQSDAELFTAAPATVRLAMGLSYAFERLF
jgi:hypothetical protein